MPDRARATSFGADVAAYEQGRPEYVDEHVAWLLEGVAGRVLDLAAGSGKLTRAVARLGFDVVAVDPPTRTARDGSGSSTRCTPPATGRTPWSEAQDSEFVAADLPTVDAGSV